MGQLSSRERVLRTVRRQDVDRIPTYIPIESGYRSILVDNLGRQVFDEILSHDDFAWISPKASERHGDFHRYFNKAGVECDEWGRGRVWDEKRQYAEYLYPLADAQSVADLEKYPWPDTVEDYRYRDLACDVEATKAKGYPAVAPLGDTLFELAWQLRGMEGLSMDMLVDTDMAEYLFDTITAQRVVTARRYAEAGVDYVILGDDVAMQTGMMMSATMWRKWMKPRLAQVIAAAKTLKNDIIMSYHSDGNCEEIVPDLIEVGVDVLNPVQPECMDAERVYSMFGGKIAFSGGIGVQSVMPFGTPDEVRQHVAIQIEKLGKGGGYIPAPSHVLERDVPVANFVAMIETIKRY